MKALDDEPVVVKAAMIAAGLLEANSFFKTPIRYDAIQTYSLTLGAIIFAVVEAITINLSRLVVAATK